LALGLDAIILAASRLINGSPWAAHTPMCAQIFESIPNLMNFAHFTLVVNTHAAINYVADTDKGFRFTFSQLGTHLRAKKKREEMSNLMRKKK